MGVIQHIGLGVIRWGEGLGGRAEECGGDLGARPRKKMGGGGSAAKVIFKESAKFAGSTPLGLSGECGQNAPGVRAT